MVRICACVLLGLFLMGSAVASVTEPSTPGPYKSLVPKFAGATLVVISYYDKSVAMVTDPKWIEEFLGTLAQADGKPRVHCFCFNYPQIELSNKEGKLASMELVHGEAIRITSDNGSGDYTIGRTAIKALGELVMRPHKGAIPIPVFPKMALPPPPKIDVKPL